MPHSLFKKFISEPLVHFLVIAISFFIIYDLLNPEQIDESKIIFISSNRVDLLKSGFEKTWTRKPTEEELSKMIESIALNEIYAREAQVLGLDKSDDVIKRRLRQKMEFILQDMSALKQPSPKELNSFYQDNIDKYRKDDKYSFEQVYISADRSATDIEKIINQQKQRIAQGQVPLGDSSMLPSNIAQSSTYQVNRQFGQNFNSFLDDAKINQWVGPIKSGFGLHFIKLKQKTKGQAPLLAKIENQVNKDWRYQQSKLFKEDYQKNLLNRYQINIEPQPSEVK